MKGGLTRRCNGRGFAAPLIAKALGRILESGLKTNMAEMRHTFFVDASCDLDRGVIGIGVVMRATEKPGRRPGPVVESFAEAYVGISHRQAEKFAVFRALEIAAEYSAARVKVRSDYNYMRTTLKKDHASGAGLDRKDLHGGVLNLAAQFREVKFAYVPRRKNQEAHRLARKAVHECTPLRRNVP